MQVPLQSARSSLNTSSIRGQRSVARGGNNRKGLTLLEMLLAAVILATALSVLAQHNSSGTTAALRSQLETEAAMRCQSQLNRLLCDKQMPANLSERPFEDDPRWYWSASRSPSKYAGLWMLTVEVFQEGRHKNISTFSLSRLCSTRTESNVTNSSGDHR